MKSTTIKVRLNDEEHSNLLKMVGSEVKGCENPAEWFRMILWREWKRRHRLGRVKPSDYMTSYRTGRPKEISPDS